MATPPSAPGPILGLPSDLLQEIFTLVFKSTTIRSDMIYGNRGPKRHPLAILSVCRRFHLEASPLAIPNVEVDCDSNAAFVQILSKMSPAQIAQLRNMTVSFVPIGFNLFQEEQEGAVGQGCGSDLHSTCDCEEWGINGETPDYVQHFHLGAVLGLFPGLQLDQLVVHNGTNSGPWTGDQVVDCFGSLLEADGYRELRMMVSDGDGEWYQSRVLEHQRWKAVFEKNFRPYGGSVQIPVRRCEWRDRGKKNSVFREARKAGFTLVNVQNAGETEGDDGEYDDEEEVEEHWFVFKRGESADIAVKDDGRVLRCIETEGPDEDYVRVASDALRKLFRENSWGAIKAMENFDTGYFSDSEGPGNWLYANMW